MGNLVITSVKGGIRFNSNSLDYVIRGFNTKRYKEQNKLVIVSSSKENYDEYIIKFNDYDSITVNGTAATSLENLQELLYGISTGGAQDVSMQDQTTRPIIVKFNNVEQSTTLASGASKGDTSITLTDDTGIAVGKYIIIFNPTTKRFMFATCTSILTTPTITIDTPIETDFAAGTNVDIAETNIKSIGSLSVPIAYGLRGTGSPPGVDLTVDITRLIFTATCTSAVDLSKFINLAELDNGLVLRKRNDITENIFNVKNNKEIAGIMYDWTPFAATNPNQGVDGFVSRLTFAGQNKIGVAIRLPIGEDLELLVQDDIQTAQSGESITKFEITAEGHIVED
jgi:hypothetical protein